MSQQAGTIPFGAVISLQPDGSRNVSGPGLSRRWRGVGHRRRHRRSPALQAPRTTAASPTRLISAERSPAVQIERRNQRVFAGRQAGRPASPRLGGRWRAWAARSPRPPRSIALAVAPDGFTVADIAAQVRTHTGGEYSVRQAGYDLPKLRGKQLGQAQPSRPRCRSGPHKRDLASDLPTTIALAKIARLENDGPQT